MSFLSDFYNGIDDPEISDYELCNYLRLAAEEVRNLRDEVTVHIGNQEILPFLNSAVNAFKQRPEMAEYMTLNAFYNLFPEYMKAYYSKSVLLCEIGIWRRQFLITLTDDLRKTLPQFIEKATAEVALECLPSLFEYIENRQGNGLKFDFPQWFPLLEAIWRSGDEKKYQILVELSKVLNLKKGEYYRFPRYPYDKMPMEVTKWLFSGFKIVLCNHLDMGHTAAECDRSMCKHLAPDCVPEFTYNHVLHPSEIYQYASPSSVKDSLTRHVIDIWAKEKKDEDDNLCGIFCRN